MSGVTGWGNRLERRCSSTNPGIVMPLYTVPVEEIDWIKGVAYPRGVRFREIIITGPPSSGKSALVQKLGGWPEEGFIDLARNNWWHSRILTFRPREVHFGIPFMGARESLAVFDPAWLAAPAPVDYTRIQIPPGKSWFFQFNWRARFIFDFQLPPVDQLYSVRSNRAAAASHPVDRMLSKQDVERQSAVYELLALHFHHCGMRVIVRTEFAGMPRVITDPDVAAA